jgi:hypothetical protein
MRKDGIMNMYLNGVSTSGNAVNKPFNTEFTIKNPSSAIRLVIGNIQNNNPYNFEPFYGQIASIRIIDGRAMYPMSANFMEIQNRPNYMIDPNTNLQLLMMRLM